MRKGHTKRQRQRKFHRRSRNGCSTCKTKHIRCDERKPLWYTKYVAANCAGDWCPTPTRKRYFASITRRFFTTYCLRHGGECGYPDGDAESSTPEPGRGSGSRAGSREPHESAEPRLPLVDASLKDPFLGTSYDMPHKSRSLFQLFANTRVLYTTRVERSADSFIVHKALSHPGFLHAALLMTALHWAWCTGDVEHFRVPYLYHKLQAIRFVTDQLRNPDAAIHDGTIAAVSSLALVENALGSVDAVSSHLRGLAKIKELQGEDRRPRKMGLLQRMILMAARSVSSRPVWDILDISRTDLVHQSVIISLLRVALRPIYSLRMLGSSYDSKEPLSEILARKAPHSRVSDSNALSPLRSVDSSRSGFIACYFYLYVIIREGMVDSFILNWFIEQLLADVCRTEMPMQTGQYSQSLWFWSVMFGACVTMAAKISDDLERKQMKVYRDVYLDKINLVSRVLKIKNWEAAKSTLRLFAWEDDFDGETELEAVWEEAVWESEKVSCKWYSGKNVEYQKARNCW